MTTLTLRDPGFVGSLSDGDPDPYFANVVLLLHGNGTNGSTSIIDSSPNPKTVTAVGNAQISTAQAKFSGSSIALDGAGDWLTATIDPIYTSAAAYTIESWFYLNTRSGFTIISRSSGGFYMVVVGGNMYVGDVGFNTLITDATLFPVDEWFHTALTFDGTAYRLFIGGILQNANTSGLTNYAMTTVKIGAYNEFHSSCYINDFRITQNIARYIANFTPPTAPFPDF